MSEMILVDMLGRYYTKESLFALQRVLAKALGRCSLSGLQYDVGNDIFKDIERILKKEE